MVDGSGETHAEPVAEEYPVEYVAQDEDRGAHAARNAGAVRADGEYVQFLDDDRLRPEKFAKQLPLFREGVGVVYCGSMTPASASRSPTPNSGGPSSNAPSK